MGSQKGHEIFTTTLFLLSLLIDNTSSGGVKCIENGRFYRDPDRPPRKIWTSGECSRYFLCLEGEVFDFRCSQGLLFDIRRQICDFKSNVDNCDVTAEETNPKPLLSKANCSDLNRWKCADGNCLPYLYFCDGSLDCPDGSDEAHCDPHNDPNSATSCNLLTCRLPDCFCSIDGTRIPGNLLPSETPQMIILTFNDAINHENWEFYNEIFDSKLKNPDGCPIKATFFVSHQHNNYHQTQRLWNRGHEIAVHSITHRAPEDWWSSNATVEDWFDEMVGEANILHKFSGIKLSEIRGMRVPFLQVGWNRQFLMMKEFGFAYDSSMVAPFRNPPLWPYTLDHKFPHECTGNNQNCPSRSYPGLWEIVINPLEANEYSCSMVDSCPSNHSGDDIYTMLMHNFKRHYLTNRAPLGLHLHSTWFKKREYLEAFKDFLADVLQESDVWFVTNWEAISWMRNPTPIRKMNVFDKWGCNKRFDKTEIACNIPNVCKLHSGIFQQDRYLYTCFQCPERYPWIRNEFGFERL